MGLGENGMAWGLTVILEEGVQAVEGGQPQVPVVLPEEAGQEGDAILL